MKNFLQYIKNKRNIKKKINSLFKDIPHEEYIVSSFYKKYKTLPFTYVLISLAYFKTIFSSIHMKRKLINRRDKQ